MTMFEDKWYPVARADELVLRHVYHAQLMGVELALWRADSGEVNAWENRCPHRSVRLTLGVNTGQTLKCQYHGWQYQSGDGQCSVVPSSGDGSVPHSLCAKSFSVIEDNGLLWVNLTRDYLSVPKTLKHEFVLPSTLLRSITIHAPQDLVQTTLSRFCHYDRHVDKTTFQTHEADFMVQALWQEYMQTVEVLFMLQPAHEQKTVLHVMCNQEDDALKWTRRINQALTVIKRELEAGRDVKEVIPVIAPSPVQTLPRWLPARVIERKMIADQVMAFRLHLPSFNRFRGIEAGAHIDIKTPEGLVRQYSLVEWDSAEQELLIGVKLEPESRGGSASMHNSVHEGAVLEVSAPKNHFRLVPNQAALLIAGGIGVTPIVSMAAQLKRHKLPYHLHYFVRNIYSRAFVDQLNALGNVSFYQGMLPEEVATELKPILAKVTLEQPHVYVCGPKGLLDTVYRVIKDNDWSHIQVHYELFANAVSHTDEHTFKVTLAKSGMSYIIPSGVSITDALREYGVHIDTSCEQGVCGTCYTKVLSGEIEHKDVYLNEEEKQGQSCIMPCVSRSAKGDLVLDI
ncbi:MAG: Rieske 2Fe-2S domain-containing protein [Alcaligenaceae bacterium]|nr:Rieske 2Fe-2S domain-containing protein [Alcaligenaceae bacterium]